MRIRDWSSDVCSSDRGCRRSRAGTGPAGPGGIMTLLVFGSARSSPGATTAALAVSSWIDRSVVVEADPDGGVVAVRYGLAREQIGRASCRERVGQYGE